MRKIVFANRKGGCGKTTLTVNVGVYLGMLNKKVLVVDLDSQAHTTLYLGANPYTRENNFFEILQEINSLGSVYDIDLTNKNYIHKTKFDNVFIIPSSIFLNEINIDKITNGEIFADRIISTYQNDFDFILIDTSPALDAFTINGFVAADEVIIPVEMHFLSLQGLTQLVREIYRINSVYNKNLKITGVVPTLFNKRTKIYKLVLEELKKVFPENVIFSGVRYDIKLAEAPSFQSPISLYAPKSRGAKDILEITKHIIGAEEND